MENYALYHHGIKGQRWGIRRFQKKDGSLTPAGKKRYDESTVGPKKTKHRLALEERYKKQGYSQEESEVLAKRWDRIEKVMLGTAAVTVAACGAYAANKYIKNRTDGLIKAGGKLQRIEGADTKGKLHDVFYASEGEHDNQRYKGLLGMTRKNQRGHAYLMELEASKDIRVASKEKAAKVFEDLYKNDPEFRLSVRDNVRQHFGGKNKVDPSNLSKRNIRKMYENFNAGLIDIRIEGSGADTKFYKQLKKAGYGAIQDINDMKYSGYKAKNPLIIFDNSRKNVMVKSMSELTDTNAIVKDGVKELDKASAEKFAESFLTKWGPVSATAMTAAVGTSYVTDSKHTTNNKT